MNKNFEKLQKKVREIESEIKTETTRLSETEAVLSEVIRQIGEGTERLKVFLLARNTTAADKCKAEISELEKQRGFAELLIPALKTKGERLSADLIEAQQKLDLRFSEVAEKWIESEIKSFDLAAENLIDKQQRLLAVQEQLRDRELGIVYTNAVGSAAAVLLGFRIPLISGFDKATFLSGGLQQFGQDFRDKIYSEIIGK